MKSPVGTRLENTYRELSMNNIVIENLRRVNTGCLLAFFTVRLPDGLTILDCRLVQQPGQKPWVSPPQREWRTDGGERKFAPLITWSRELGIQIEHLAVTEYQKLGEAMNDVSLA